MTPTDAQREADAKRHAQLEAMRRWAKYGDPPPPANDDPHHENDDFTKGL